MEQFGKYTLIGKIGTGGMAEVYLARTVQAQGLTKGVVIKKIRTAFAHHARSSSRCSSTRPRSRSA